MSNYNGYSNRETWATALHINNNVNLYYCLGPLRFDYQGSALAIRIRNNLYRYLGQNDFVEVLEDIGDVSLVNWDEVAESLNSST